VLHDSIVFPRRLDKPHRFLSVMTARFFDIHVFASGTGGDGGRSVPMVRCRDHQGIDGLVIEYAAKIGHTFGPVILILHDRIDGLPDVSLIDIADVSDLDTRQRGQLFGQICASTVAANAVSRSAHSADSDSTTGRIGTAQSVSQSKRHRPGQ
jgi:hypothetical protein